MNNSPAISVYTLTNGHVADITVEGETLQLVFTNRADLIDFVSAWANNPASVEEGLFHQFVAPKRMKQAMKPETDGVAGRAGCDVTHKAEGSVSALGSATPTSYAGRGRRESGRL